MEIDEAIFARVSDRWFERTGSEDPEYVAGLRAAGVAALDYVLVGIERSGESLDPVPAAVLAQARRAARTGVGLDTVLRRYLAGYALFEDFVVQEAERGEKDRIPPDQGSALRDVLQIISTLVDRLIAAVSSAYNKEIEQAGDTALASEDSPAPDRHSTSSSRAGSGARGGPGVSRAALRGSQHARILQAMVEVVAEYGFADVTVRLVTARAGVSSRTFYECFEDLEDCFSAVLDIGLERPMALIERAFASEEDWQDGIRAALASLLVFFDSEPLLTRIWFKEMMAAGSWVLERRERHIAILSSMIVDRSVSSVSERPDAVVVMGVMASVLGVIQAHVVTEEPGPLIELLGPLMGLIATHYLDARGVEREVERGAQLARKIQAEDPGWASARAAGRDTELGMRRGVTLPAILETPGARRARECVLFLADHPESSNRELATGIGVVHQSQISRLLAYLAGESLVVKRSEGAGKRNAWRLTPRGEEMARALFEQQG